MCCCVQVRFTQTNRAIYQPTSCTTYYLLPLTTFSSISPFLPSSTIADHRYILSQYSDALVAIAARSICLAGHTSRKMKNTPPRRPSITPVVCFIIFLCFVPATGALCAVRAFTDFTIRMELIRKSYLCFIVTANWLQFLEPTFTHWLRRNLR